MPKWQWILKQFTSRLWWRATIFCLIGILTAFFAVLFKDFIPPHISRTVGAEAVDAILGILASSMLAVTTFSLSTMVAAYAAASSSATPRATKLLLEDSTTQNALSVFIGSFLYSLVGIIALQIGVYGESGRLILFVVTLAVIFIIIAMLLQWMDHLSRLGRVGDTIDLVEIATQKAIKQRLKKPCLGGTPLVDYKPKPSHVALKHPDIGYIQHMDMQQLSELAEDYNIQIFIHALPGVFNDSNKALLYVSKPLDDATYETLRNVFSINGDRSFDQDPRYGLIVLSEVASRALSPAVNDPGTAIDVIGTVVRVLASWVSNDAPIEVEYPRIHVPAIKIADLFDDTFTSIARDGAGIIEVGIRLQKAFASLAAISVDKEYSSQAKMHSTLAFKRASQALKLEEDINRLASYTLK